VAGRRNHQLEAQATVGRARRCAHERGERSAVYCVHLALPVLEGERKPSAACQVHTVPRVVQRGAAARERVLKRLDRRCTPTDAHDAPRLAHRLRKRDSLRAEVERLICWHHLLAARPACQRVNERAREECRKVERVHMSAIGSLVLPISHR